MLIDFIFQKKLTDTDQYRRREQSVGQFWPTRIEVKIDRFATDFLYPLLMIGGLFVVSKPTAANLQVLPKFGTYRGKQDNHRASGRARA